MPEPLRRKGAMRSLLEAKPSDARVLPPAPTQPPVFGSLALGLGTAGGLIGSSASLI